MPALTCNQSTLTAATGCLSCLSKKEKQALLVLYLYRQKNPASAAAVPVSTLLAQAACLACAPSDSSIDDMEVYIQRQAALDSGLVEPTFSASVAIKNVVGMKALSFKQLRAMEILLRCQLS